MFWAMFDSPCRSTGRTSCRLRDRYWERNNRRPYWPDASSRRLERALVNEKLSITHKHSLTTSTEQTDRDCTDYTVAHRTRLVVRTDATSALFAVSHSIGFRPVFGARVFFQLWQLTTTRADILPTSRSRSRKMHDSNTVNSRRSGGSNY